MSRAQLEEKVTELTRCLQAIEENTVKAIVCYEGNAGNSSEDAADEPEEEAEESTAEEAAVSPPQMYLPRIDLKLMTVDDTDTKRAQLYFFESGPLLIPELPTKGIVVKFGSSESIYRRVTTHRRDFGGGRLIDSVLSVNAKAVETEFKKWMNATGRLITAKTANKATVDGEIFVVHSQEEYAVIVNKAIKLAREHQQEAAMQNDVLTQVQGVRQDIATMMASMISSAQ